MTPVTISENFTPRFLITQIAGNAMMMPAMLKNAMTLPTVSRPMPYFCPMSMSTGETLMKPYTVTNAKKNRHASAIQRSPCDN